MQDEKKLNLILLVFGTVVGLCLYLVGSYVVKNIIFKPAAGSSFENTDDLRKAITEAEQVDPNKNAPFRALLNPHPSDEIIYVLKPNLDLKFQDAKVKTNSFGLRGAEISLDKPKDTYRIILLGDSFAFGWGVEYEQSFAYLTEQYLNEKTNGKPKIEILNFGVPGYSNFQEVARYFADAAKFSPDAVLVYFVENDFGLPFFIRNYDQPNSMLGANEFNKLKNEQGGKYDKLANGLDPNQHLLKLAADCKSKNIPLFVAINPNRSAIKVREKLWSLNNNPDINLIWMRDELLEKVKREKIDIKTLSLPNDPHPSPKSHINLATMLSNQIYNKIFLKNN